MTTFIILYLISLGAFIVCDLLWLGVFAKGFYQKHLGYILGEVSWVPAIIFYLLFITGLTYFVTYPLLESSLLKVFLTGAFFGLVTYATYDLTNHATVRDWPYIVTFVDLVWGALLGGVISLCAVAVYRLVIG
jgi:uncharacterized membrane protein